MSFLADARREGTKESLDLYDEIVSLGCRLRNVILLQNAPLANYLFSPLVCFTRLIEVGH